MIARKNEVINELNDYWDVTFTPEDTYQVHYIIYDVTFTPEDTYILPHLRWWGRGKL